MKRKVKKTVQKSRKQIGILVGVLAVLIVLIALVVRSPGQEKETLQRAKYELIDVDVFALDDWHTSEVSVMGVMLGDSTEKATEILGYPNAQTMHEKNIVNMEYSSNVGMNGTGLILHFENGILRRITLREPFNKFLKGSTKIQYTKDKMYALFGKPDDILFIPLKEGSALVFRSYVYEDKGIEVFIRKQSQIGFSLSL